MDRIEKRTKYGSKRTKYGRQRSIDMAKLAKRRSIVMREKGITTERITKELLKVYGGEVVEEYKVEYYVAT